MADEPSLTHSKSSASMLSRKSSVFSSIMDGISNIVSVGSLGRRFSHRSQSRPHHSHRRTASDQNILYPYETPVIRPATSAAIPSEGNSVTPCHDAEPTTMATSVASAPLPSQETMIDPMGSGVNKGVGQDSDFGSGSGTSRAQTRSLPRLVTDQTLVSSNPKQATSLPSPWRMFHRPFRSHKRAGSENLPRHPLEHIRPSPPALQASTADTNRTNLTRSQSMSACPAS